MIAYMSSPAPAPVSLPLNKCNYGTILQVSCIMLLVLVVCFDFATMHIIEKIFWNEEKLYFCVIFPPPPTWVGVTHTNPSCQSVRVMIFLLQNNIFFF